MQEQNYAVVLRKMISCAIALYVVVPWGFMVLERAALIVA
jgi:hypothetical protein